MKTRSVLFFIKEKKKKTFVFLLGHKRIKPESWDHEGVWTWNPQSLMVQSHEANKIWQLSTEKATERKEDAMVASGVVGSAMLLGRERKMKERENSIYGVSYVMSYMVHHILAHSTCNLFIWYNSNLRVQEFLFPLLTGTEASLHFHHRHCLPS